MVSIDQKLFAGPNAPAARRDSAFSTLAITRCRNPLEYGFRHGSIGVGSLSGANFADQQGLGNPTILPGRNMLEPARNGWLGHQCVGIVQGVAASSNSFINLLLGYHQWRCDKYKVPFCDKEKTMIEQYATDLSCNIPPGIAVSRKRASLFPISCQLQTCEKSLTANVPNTGMPFFEFAQSAKKIFSESS